MKQIKTKHKRNYTIFCQVASGLTYSAVAKKHRVSTARAEQIFRFTLLKICKDKACRFIQEDGWSAAETVRANSAHWIGCASMSHESRTGLPLII